MRERATADPLSFRPDDVRPVADGCRPEVRRPPSTTRYGGRPGNPGRSPPAGKDTTRREITAMLAEARGNDDDALAKIVGAPDRRAGSRRAGGHRGRDLERTRRDCNSGPARDRASAGAVMRALEAPLAELRTTAAQLAAESKVHLARRRELRGRLDGYRAKAQALGRSRTSAWRPCIRPLAMPSIARRATSTMRRTGDGVSAGPVPLRFRRCPAPGPAVMKCARPGCTGLIEDGFCDVCGLAPVAGLRQPPARRDRAIRPPAASAAGHRGPVLRSGGARRIA